MYYRPSFQKTSPVTDLFNLPLTGGSGIIQTRRLNYTKGGVPLTALSVVIEGDEKYSSSMVVSDSDLWNVLDGSAPYRYVPDAFDTRMLKPVTLMELGEIASGLLEDSKAKIIPEDLKPSVSSAIGIVLSNGGSLMYGADVPDTEPQMLLYLNDTLLGINDVPQNKLLNSLRAVMSRMRVRNTLEDYLKGIAALIIYGTPVKSFMASPKVTGQLMLMLCDIDDRVKTIFYENDPNPELPLTAAATEAPEEPATEEPTKEGTSHD